MVVAMVKKLQKLGQYATTDDAAMSHITTGPLPAKELVDKLMTEEGHSVSVKDKKVATELTASSSSTAPLPWSAEEQKVEFKV